MKHFHPVLRPVRDTKNKESDKPSLVQIKERKKEIRRFKCEHCSKIYKRQRFLKMHLSKMHQKLSSGRRLDKKMKTTNELEDKQEKTFKCEVCSKYFGSKNFLKGHIVALNYLF